MGAPTPRRNRRRGAEAWRTFSLFNPVVYLINGFRWTFYGVSVNFSLTEALFGAYLVAVAWIFQTGYRLELNLR